MKLIDTDNCLHCNICLHKFVLQFIRIKMLIILIFDFKTKSLAKILIKSFQEQNLLFFVNLIKFQGIFTTKELSVFTCIR